MRDTVPLVMQGEGVDMEEATKEDWLAAIDKIDQAVDSGQIRRFTATSYTEDLTAGNVVAAIGWSGDGSLIGREDAEWRKPTDGCDTFFDQMVIPVGAPNTAAALEFMNFVYGPRLQADIAAYVNYVHAGRGRAGDHGQAGSRSSPRTRSSSRLRSSPRAVARTLTRRAISRTSARSRRRGRR